MSSLGQSPAGVNEARCHHAARALSAALRRQLAARDPKEVRLPAPAGRFAPALTEAERDDFAALHLDVLSRLDGLYDRPLPYVAGWHQAPANTGRDPAGPRLRARPCAHSAMGDVLSPIPLVDEPFQSLRDGAGSDLARACARCCSCALASLVGVGLRPANTLERVLVFRYGMFAQRS